MDDCEIIGLCFGRSKTAISEIVKKYVRLCSSVAKKTAECQISVIVD